MICQPLSLCSFIQLQFGTEGHQWIIACPSPSHSGLSNANLFTLWDNINFAAGIRTPSPEFHFTTSYLPIQQCRIINHNGLELEFWNSIWILKPNLNFRTWVWIPVLPLTICVTLGTLHNLHVSQPER